MKRRRFSPTGRRRRSRQASGPAALFKKSSDEERKERLAELEPMVLEIINTHVHSFSVVVSQEEALMLDSQGIAILKELMALVRPKPTRTTARTRGHHPRQRSWTTSRPPSKRASTRGPLSTPPSRNGSGLLRDRIIQNAQDALEFLSEAFKIARVIVNAEKHLDEAVVVLDDNHVGVLSRIIHDHTPPGLTVTERNLAEEIDQVVTRTLAQSWDNADARNRGVRRATAAVFRRYMLKPVGEPYDSTVAYIEVHYLVD